LALDGNSTVVIDGQGGLGLGIARELARNSATVIITSRNIASEYEQDNIRLYLVALGDVYTDRRVDHFQEMN
jgi:NAD(P)-dependent dehydrogenase (short-subunit alcohol dehydrogenase family)